MGVVYKAEQISLSRTVALKVLKAELSSAGDFRARFLREARLAASVDHPNVVTVYDVGEDDGQLFLVMQWVPGSDLKTALRRDGAMDSYRVSILVRQIGSALDAVHGAGLLHRDIKPSNVLLRQVGAQDHSYLTDFGVAVAPDSPERLTGSGAVVGTVGYISPEQIMGQVPDTRSDLYALGCLTFELLTGAPPFRAENEMGLRWAHVHNVRPIASQILPALGPNFDDFFAQALSVDSAGRFENGEAFAEAFMDAKRGGGVRVTLKAATSVSAVRPSSETLAATPALESVQALRTPVSDAPGAAVARTGQPRSNLVGPQPRGGRPRKGVPEP
jgi:serine/threonine-protein kinase